LECPLYAITGLSQCNKVGEIYCTEIEAYSFTGLTNRSAF
jgi:hypothetical protein